MLAPVSGPRESVQRGQGGPPLHRLNGLGHVGVALTVISRVAHAHTGGLSGAQVAVRRVVTAADLLQ